MKKYLSYILIMAIFLGASPAFSTTLSARLSGRILLQAESKGEAWYVEPQTGLRYFLGRPSDAFAVMRRLGLGVSNANLLKIGTDPKFSQKMSGRILLQVESKGEAWYVNPTDLKRFYLGRPADAFSLMRSLGLGISNANLAKIPAATVESDVVADLEKRLFDDVNQERTKAGLQALKRNDRLAAVARLQSQSLADENASFAGLGRACDYPMIHHENISIGFMNTDRLADNKVYNYSQAGENIALYSASTYKVSYDAGDPVASEIDGCTAVRDKLGDSFKSRLDSARTEADKKAIIAAEIALRQKLFNQAAKLEIVGLVPYKNDYLAAEITRGWMESEGHRENILHQEYDEAGMGVVIMNGYAYATQVFTKRAECGYETGQCCEKEGFYPYCFEGLECGEGICG